MCQNIVIFILIFFRNIIMLIICQATMINWGYVLILFLLGFLIYKRKSLDALGSVVMIVMGIIIIFSAGFNWLLLILIFLILSQ